MAGCSGPVDQLGFGSAGYVWRRQLNREDTTGAEARAEERDFNEDRPMTARGQHCYHQRADS